MHFSTLWNLSLSELSNDQEAVYGTRIVNYILKYLFLCSLLLLIGAAFVFVRKWAALLLVLTVLGIIITAIVLLKKGSLKYASLFLLSSLWMIFTTIVWFSGGINNIAPIYYLIVTILAGLLLGQRASAGVAALSCFTLTVIYTLGNYGIKAPVYFPIPLRAALFLWFSIFLTTIPLINFAFNLLKDALAHAEKEIRERVRAEEELKDKSLQLFEQNLFIQNINSESPDIIYIYDLEKHSNTYINKNLNKLLGYEEDELEDDSFKATLKLLHPEDIQQFDDYQEKVQNWKEDYVLEFEYRLLAKNGEWRWFSGKEKVFKKNEERIISLIGTVREITEKRETEKQLLIYKHVMANVSDAMFLLAKDGSLILANTATSKLLGYSMEELLELKVFDFDPTFPLEKWNKNWDSLKATGLISFESTHLSKLKTLIPVEISLTYVEHDGVEYHLALVRDITDRKHIENELLNAKEKAEEMSRLKSSFLANMSHELRTPMIGILGYSDLLEDQPINSQQRKYARMINQSGKRLMETLNLILDLSRIEAGKLELRLENVHIVEVVQEVSQLFQGLAKQKNLYLRMQPFSVNPVLQLDASMFRQIINNLINNAIKFTHHGGVSVAVSTEDRLFVPYVIVSIIDTGIGIAKQDQELIWDEFRQVSEGKARNFEGTGLGLSITKKFVEKLGGEISVESELGQGSIFTVSFPIDTMIQEEEIFVEEENTLSGSTGPEAAEYSVPKILYVEDDNIAIAFVSTVLEDKCILDTVTTSKNALAMAKQNTYAAILMDINLGKDPVDGVQTTKLIRKLEGKADIPIIALTAFAMKGDKEEFLNAGCTHYLSKPFTKAELLAVLHDAIGMK